jgi:hypothetical protein
LILCFKTDERETRNQKRWESEAIALEVPDGIDSRPYIVQQENYESPGLKIQRMQDIGNGIMRIFLPNSWERKKPNEL